MIIANSSSSLARPVPAARGKADFHSCELRIELGIESWILISQVPITSLMQSGIESVSLPDRAKLIAAMEHALCSFPSPTGMVIPSIRILIACCCSSVIVDFMVVAVLMDV
jgi:hypothetical protein